MSQISTKLRRGHASYFHWCPGCEEMHPLPDRWTFDGNLEAPSFTPSFKHTLTRFDSYTSEGIGLGGRREVSCHYVLTAGKLHFCDDSHHVLKGQVIDLPELPIEYRDWLEPVVLAKEEPDR